MSIEGNLKYFNASFSQYTGGYEILSSCVQALEAARAVKYDKTQDRGIWTHLSVINGSAWYHQDHKKQQSGQ
ncbi:hypothetical protein JOQ06_030442 [Pogonophryne albipinna]|uniref:Uncharacterized protein n=1 Tax=Pogonophryne albipinna TaxID=1090488 RepID=A0AAD6AY43_9TELE|nr:hypothetical protein JOQ06_030442 [Pogonophryne albipinna]